ncbi:MAG: M28 family peptidase [Thermodesulfobacteriota bacterium]
MTPSFDLENMLAWARDLYAFGIKRPGTVADQRAEAYLLGLLRGFGLPEVSSEEVPFIGWFHEQSLLAARGPSGDLTLAAEPIVYTQFTSPAGITAPLVDLGPGRPEDFAGRDLRGRIALVTYAHGYLPYDGLRDLALYLHDPDESLSGQGQVMTWVTDEEMRVYRAAVSAGAVGLIGVFPLDVTPYLCYEGGHPFTGRTGPIPGLALRRSAGEALRRLAAEAPAEATMLLTGRMESAVTRNIVGLIPGESERVIQVTSHHDTMWLGATEDISGVVVVLALAQALSRQYAGRKPEHTLAVVLEGAECLYVLGSRGHIGRHRRDLIHNLVADLHIEHLAREYVEENGRLRPTGRLQPRALFVTRAGPLPDLAREMVVRHDLRRTIVMPTDTPIGCPTDASAYARSDLPVVSFISAPLYWNALEDTFDKLAEEALVPTAGAYWDLIQALLQTEPSAIRPPGPPGEGYQRFKD